MFTSHMLTLLSHFELMVCALAVLCHCIDWAARPVTSTPPACYPLGCTAAAQEPERCSQQMLALLLARLGDARAAPLTRSAAAAYTGSFLARAAFVPPPLVVTAVQVGRACRGCRPQT